MSPFQSIQKEYLSQEFSDLHLSGDEISAIEFDGCTFKGCDFSEVIFKKCKFIDCHFNSCNLSLINVAYSQFLDVLFDNCKMIGIDWTRAHWPCFDLYASIKFDYCIINDCSFFGLNLSEIVIESCKVHCVDFRAANFSEASFRYSDLSNSLFNETDLSNTDFSEATNYTINIFNNKMKGAKFSRYEAISLLDSLGIELVD
ncbi:pentapeptide repeat-containing protein [Psychromonas antarctica]|uniref:pentapeptide repeat-containing protein n=1 Tax=Psychromonas antarctica TaxID=67573 RepID=UPI001EE9247F|nr:pentapeptide repeat-containing protein [Psychromonas antarctica]MCG6202356.1 pentapeptide repeat-containing protein [Psychromonas antarctica]